ncbi:MAG: extracellular solute-binding protein [Oscillospiraceae bacterium]|nr:extracellular solute-binding protein [Oscillospiraceae bacterium]
MARILKFRAPALFLALFMIVSFMACAKNEENNNTPTENNPDAQNAADAADQGDAAEVKLFPDLDENADFGGHVFNILTRTSTSGDWLDWIPRDVVYKEEQSGDTINDAVFKRNTYIEEKYNFKIEQLFTENFGGDIKKSINAGDELYDMIESPMREASGFAQNGYFMNLLEVPNLDFNQPWWDQGAREILSFGHKIYFMSGDLLMVNNDTCCGFVFNKELLKDLALEDPYPLVKEGKWTMAKLYDLCKDASSDLNGDGVYDYKDDRFGLIGQRDTLISFLHSAGEYICKKDDNDWPYITFGSERSIAAMEACFKVMYEGNITHNAHHLEGKVPAIYPVSEEMFMDNRVLFMWVRLRIVENLRSMDKDFGILPLPKLDESQPIYRTDVISYTGCLMCVPVTTSNPERTGHILEAICAESKYTTMPAYYDVTLKTKMARDEDSSDMLDIIFANRVWDIGEISNFGDFGWQLIAMSMKNDSNIASLFEKRQGAMQKDIDKAIGKYEALD